MHDSDEYIYLLKKYNSLAKELAQQKEKVAFLEKVIHAVPANIYVSDLEKGVIWCNRTNEETLGYTLEEIQEMGGIEYLFRVVHPEDHNVPVESVDHYRNFNGAEFGGLFRAKHKDEETYKWFVGWARSFSKDEKGEVKEVVCVDVDMTPQMNTDKQLVTVLREQLKSKNKLLVTNLRKRELEIMQLICQGYRTKAISEKLNLSVHTVTTHRKNIQRKLGTSNVADLVSLAKEAGLV